MMAEPAAALGIPLRLLAEAEGVSAAQVIPDHVVGDYRDLDALTEVTGGCAVVTFDHEHVPTEHLDALAAAGVACRPGPGALVHAQDKAVMRDRLAELGVPCPRNAVVAPPADVEAFGFPCVLKTTRGGYDGKGVWFVASARRVRRGVRGRRGERRTPAGRGAGRLPARALGAGGAVPERPGGGVRGRRVGAARRHLPRGRRTGARPRPRPGRRGAAAGAAGRRRARRDRRAGRGAVRDHRRPDPRQRARDATAQHRALDPGRRGHLAVREPPPRRARPAARSPAPRPRGR